MLGHFNFGYKWSPPIFTRAVFDADSIKTYPKTYPKTLFHYKN